MYYFVVGAVFKNEAHILSEWLEHYIYHGVEKFYLINDNSSDNFMEILQPYIDNGLVTLFNPIEPQYQMRQSFLYSRYLLPLIKKREFKWIAIVDLDEFIYSPREKDITKILRMNENIGQIMIFWTHFGSNGHIKQPKNVVQSFTKKGLNPPITQRKNIINTDFPVRWLGIHESHVYGPVWWLGDNLAINHYRIQSLEFWQNVKMTRGDADCYDVRDMEIFKSLDLNDVDDFCLAQQNKDIIPVKLENINTYYCEMPKDTYHQFCKNFLGGSKYGTDGILEKLMSLIDMPKKCYQLETEPIQILPCLYENYSCFVHPEVNIYKENAYSCVKTINNHFSQEKFGIVSCDISTWKEFKNSPYHSHDSFVVLINLPENTLDMFLDAVKNSLQKKYTPIAFCMKTLVVILSCYIEKLADFPYIVGTKETDYLSLYTNLYLDGETWKYDKNMEKDMARRNFYLQFSRFPKEDENLDSHIKSNRSLIWKPLIKF